MHIQNGVYRDMALRWDMIELPLKAGTPIALAGYAANSGIAVGIMPQTITERPVTGYASVLVGGAVSLAEVERLSGLTISAAAKRSMRGITFFGADGTPEADPVYELPGAATTTQAGIVKQAANVAAVTPADDTATALETAVNDILSALKAAGLMAADAS